MWAVAIAFVVSAACVAASWRRLIYVYDACTFDPELLLAALRGDRGRRRAPAILKALAAEAPEARDRDLFAALALPSDDENRGALLSEALLELDYRFLRWARVPRVSASIASSAGFLLATWALRLSLVAVPATSDDHFRATLEAALASALGVVAVGAIGTVGSLAAFYEARRVARARKAATDKLIDRLDRLADPDVSAEGAGV